jgi:hypothetical protein
MGRGAGRISHRAAARLAWFACTMTVVLLAGAVALAMLSDRFGAYKGLFAVDLMLCVLVGALTASRKPANTVGWILLGGAVCLARQEFAREYAAYGLLVDPGSLLLVQPMAWLVSWIYAPGLLLLIAFLPLYFPDGRLPAPRWKWIALSAAFCTVSLAVVSAILPGQIKNLQIVNPLGIEALRPVLDLLNAIITVALFAIVFAAVASLLVRFRRSVGEERQQIKWLLYAAAAIPAWFLINPLLSAAFPALSDVAAFELVDILLLAGTPIAIGVAILKYRLYDIDVVINRTLVYGTLTATLVALYFSGIVVLQRIFVLLTGQQSTIAIVASTLLIAALFTPLRRRIQSFIDRRFYRSKYDARKTLEAFSAKLRDETDLDALSDDLVGVVKETIQPAHVSLWLHPGPALKDKKKKRAAIRESGRDEE